VLYAVGGIPVPPPHLDLRTHYDFDARTLMVTRYSLVPKSRFLAALGMTGGGAPVKTPNDINQVFMAIFDSLNNALRLNASLGAGGAGPFTPNDANQVSVSIFDNVNNAIRVNCVMGCATAVNVANAAVGSAYSGAGTIALTQGSASVTTSGGSWSTAQIGSILQANLTGSAANCNAAAFANTPCFRAVIVAVSGGTLTLAVPFPGTTASGIGFNAGPSAGTFNTVADLCGKINATMFGNQGTFVDASSSALTGAQTCTMNPWNAIPYSAVNGGSVKLGNTQVTSTRQIWMPQGSELYGVGRGQNSLNANTSIVADASNFTQTFSAVNVTSTLIGTTQGTATITFNTAAGSCGSDSGSNNCNTIVQTVASASLQCDSGNFGHFTLAHPLTGFVEASQLYITGNGATGWNGTWMLVAVSGLNGEVQFNGACPTTAGGGGGSATLAYANVFQGKADLSTTDTLSSIALHTAGSKAYDITLATGSDFAATDVDSCTIKNTSASITNPGPFTVVANSSSTAGTILAQADPTSGTAWANGNTLTRTCWVQGTITGISSFTPATQVAVLSTTTKAQQTFTSGSTSVTYNVGGALINATGFSGAFGGSIKAVKVHDMTAVNTVTDGIIISVNSGQETGAVNYLGGTANTYCIQADVLTSHYGPIEKIECGLSTSQNPLASAVTLAGGSDTFGIRGVRDFTVTANSGNGVVPFACLEIDTSAVAFFDIHTERCAVSFNVGWYAIPGSSPNAVKGVTISGSDCGIGLWACVEIGSGNGTASGGARPPDVAITGVMTTNKPGAGIILDNNLAPNCTAGSTTLTDGGVATQGIAYYLLNTSSATTTRLSADPSASNCLGNTVITAGQHFNQSAATSDLAGTLTCAAGTVSRTFTTAFTSTPIIVVSDETTAGGAKVSAKSNTAFTVTCTGATDAIDYQVIGNPN
jgi:hypothetical protein